MSDLAEIGMRFGAALTHFLFMGMDRNVNIVIS